MFLQNTVPPQHDNSTPSHAAATDFRARPNQRLSIATCSHTRTAAPFGARRNRIWRAGRAKFARRRTAESDPISAPPRIPRSERIRTRARSSPTDNQKKKKNNPITTIFARSETPPVKNTRTYAAFPAVLKTQLKPAEAGENCVKEYR